MMELLKKMVFPVRKLCVGVVSRLKARKNGQYIYMYIRYHHQLPHPHPPSHLRFYFSKLLYKIPLEYNFIPQHMLPFFFLFLFPLRRIVNYDSCHKT